MPKCFVFLDGSLARMPTKDWAKQARSMPGQVWCPPHVPTNGLIGSDMARIHRGHERNRA